jgi:Holliday junction resolvasome RuvABC ATP-dependent DNA helicase subunit
MPVPRGTPEAGGSGQVQTVDAPAPSDTAPATQATAAAFDASALIGTRPSRIPPDVRDQVRAAFEGFVGNENAVKRLSNDLLRALIELPPHLSKNYLLTGQPSTGKTELAKRIALALALPFVRLDGRGVQSRERLFELMKGELQQQKMEPSQSGQRAGLPVLDYPPLVVFIDEVHLVPRAVQESLLTMLEAQDRTVTLASEVARVHRATFIFATTRASDVDTAFRTRCTEVQLKEYSEGEVAEIVRRRHDNPDWSPDVFHTLARLGRSVPRIALEVARELETAVEVAEHVKSTAAHLEEVREAREMDQLGLTPIDRQYLDLLEREGRPVGEQPLLKMLGTVDRDRVLDEVEPLLRRLNFIRLGPKGREITQQGKEYLLDRRRRG